MTRWDPLRPDGEDRWGSGWQKDPNSLHTRTLADACWSLGGLIQQLPNHSSAKLWKTSLQSNVEAILDLQLENGNYGCTYHAYERRVLREDGCGGLLWIPALLRARDISQDNALADRINDSVRRAGTFYADAINDEYIYGAPEDNHSASSEDGMNAVLAYCYLYEAFGEDEYLELAIKSADWMLTFRRLFNIKPDPQSILGIYNLRSRGGDTSSASNSHLHVFEVLCTREMFKLSEWTGNDYYRNSALKHMAYSLQQLCRADGQYNGFRGAASEQFYWFNSSSFGQDTRRVEASGLGNGWDPGVAHYQKGHICGFSTVWCVNIMIFIAEAMLKKLSLPKIISAEISAPI